MNIRFHFRAWRPAIAATVVASVAGAAFLAAQPSHLLMDDDQLRAGPPVSFQSAQAIIALRCVQCHSATPSDEIFKVAPGGVELDQPAAMRASAARIRIRVESHTMPFANRTNMTDAERLTVIRWVAQGARVE